MADADPTRPAPVPLHTIDLIRHRVVDAVLGQSGLNHPALTAEIRRRFGGTDVAQGALVREPLIEGSAPFISSGRTFADCAGAPLHPDVICAISSDKAENYRFPSDARPYQHQVEAWAHLTAQERRSVLVSSGTGSGKTECFLMPLLHDLASEVEQSGQRLSGVRALMLYPLNALIASQEERLKAWTAPFDGKIRFGLYNGQMPEKLRAQALDRPEQAQDRATLRTDPPPILVTNITMLEYMTIRRIDRPLIDNSKGKLRWIILDEAHGYVGSAAAEVALLIRRVLLTFGVRAEDVRFVATSATIGDGKDVTDELRQFLRDLSGADEKRVHVVLGDRERIILPPPAASAQLSPAMLGDRGAVAANPAVQALVRAAEKGAVPLDQAEALLRPTGLPSGDVVAAIANNDDGRRTPLLPLRVHGFLRAVPGLWSCIDPACKAAPEGWPFGAILAERVESCPACTSTVLEVMHCHECGEPYLDCEEREGHFRPRITPRQIDEFPALRERDMAEDQDSEPQQEPAADYDAHRLAIATRILDKGRRADVRPMTGERCDAAQEGTQPYFVHQPDHCGACGAHGKAEEVLRPLRYGAPFLIGNAAPVLLDGVPDRVGATSLRPPADGRQLLSFTDSRQGTARFAANLQSTAERNFVRGHIYHAVQGSMVMAGSDDPEIATIRATIAALEPIAKQDPGIAALVDSHKVELARKTTPSMDGISWAKLRSGLAATDEGRKWMRDIWGLRDSRYRDDADAFAQFLLLREFGRRPRRANTLETMGLARLRFRAIDRITQSPDALRARGFGVDAWQGMLYAMLDMTVRANRAIRADDKDLHWIAAKGWRKQIMPFGEKAQVAQEVNWPMAGAGGNPSNIVLLLQKALKLDRSDKEDRRDLNELLEAAWDALVPLFTSPTQPGHALDFEQATIAPVVDAWRCPVTRRVLPILPLGMTPYGHREGLLTSNVAPHPIAFPHLPVTFPRGQDVERLRDWLAEDERVATLRDAGVWANLHDRIALQSPYLRAAEHSAQQPPARLRRFEEEFKDGAINILNCSTTMEMGVDIGSVSAVMMTNVPPALANYRQRVGRAGRRGQGFATSLTYTRDTPLDREMFRDPQAYLARQTCAPQVKLDSRRIVQRHVNALLLARWFAGEGGEALKTRAGDFFGCPEGLGTAIPESAPVDLCLAWIALPSSQQALAGEIAALTQGTVLAGDRLLFDATGDALRTARDTIRQEWAALQAQAVDAPKEGKNGIAFQLQRLSRENLLSELSTRAVLPGHGFPTNVVPFVNSDKAAADEAREGEDTSRRRRSFPTRNLDIAIRDYAPGSEVVVDGLVYQSAGVTLNWLRPADQAKSREVQSIRTFWTCPACGAADCEAVAPAHCPACHADIPLEARRRFLEPSGFTADMRAAPHADTDAITYVEPEAEQIVARGAAWVPLADPAQGRLRATHDGMVFYSSRGADRKGYHVCLECGRAEAAGLSSDRPLKDHLPLRFTGTNGAGLCPGNDMSFKITEPIALGHQTMTDVAELQPVGLEHEGAALAVISAMREALSRRLGIETGELGMAVRPAQTSIGQKTHSLYLFDRASGGAGFAPQAVPLYDSLLRDAAAILRCPQAGCVNGCSACVLTSDLHRHQDSIDRQGALVWITAALAALRDVTPEDRIGPDAQLSRAVVDDMAAALDGGAGRALVWIGADADIAGLGRGALPMLARRAADRGSTMQLVIDPVWLAGLDPAARLSLRDFAVRNDVQLQQGTAPGFPNGASAIAAVEGTTSTLWASRDAQASLPGDGWGQGQSAPVVRAPCDRLPLTTRIDADSLLPQSGTEYIELAREMDGTIADFGAKLVKRLMPAIRAAGGVPGALTRIDYNDRYLQSPLVVRLMAECIGALRDALASTGMAMEVRIVTNRLKPNERQPYAPDHDWQWEEDRRDVLIAVMADRQLTTSMIDHGALHGRLMTLHFADGKSVRLVLDQGFGPWRTPKYAKFDFSMDAQQQAVRLSQYSAMIGSPSSGYIVVTS